MAVLDRMMKSRRFPASDALSSLPWDRLFGSQIDQDGMFVTALLHIVLDIGTSVKKSPVRPLEDACKIARGIDIAFNKYRSTLVNPLPFFKDTVMLSRPSILNDTMACSRQFGTKAQLALKKTDSVLADAHAQDILRPPNTLRNSSHVLISCLAYTATHGAHLGCSRLEQESPLITTYLYLYASMRGTGNLRIVYEDAEQLLLWCGEEFVFGPSGRPEAVQKA